MRQFTYPIPTDASNPFRGCGARPSAPAPQREAPRATATSTAFRVKVLNWNDGTGKPLGGGSHETKVSFGDDGAAVFSGHIAGSGFVPSRDKPIEKRVPLQEIVNVQVGGNQVSFDAAGGKMVRVCAPGTLWTTEKERPRCVLVAADAAEAEALARLLPATITAGFIDELERRNAMARLNTTGGRPVVSYTILAINVVVFALCGLMGAGWLDADANRLLALGADQWDHTTGGEWWRLLTSAFLHGGVIHLAVNMYVLFRVGPLAERLFGRTFFALIYLLAAVLSGLASIWWDPHPVIVGASGAIFAVYGALIAFVTFQKNAFVKGEAAALAFGLLVFVVYNIGLPLMDEILAGHRTGISNGAHVGGLAAGFLLGAVMARPVGPPERRAGQAWWRLLLGAAVGAAAVASAVVMIPKSM